jgi:hypothetical protein
MALQALVELLAPDIEYKGSEFSRLRPIVSLTRDFS